MADFNSSLPVRTEAAGDVEVKVVDGSVTGQKLSVNASGQAAVVGPLTDAELRATAVPVSGPLTNTELRATAVPVSGTVTANVGTTGGLALDATLTGGAQTTRVTDGTDTMAVNADGSINVSVVTTAAGTAVSDYKSAPAVAANAADNHDYTVTATKTLSAIRVEASASAKVRMDVAIETGVGTGTFTTLGTRFNSTADPNMDFTFDPTKSVSAGVKVRVVMTNKDNQAQDLYSTIHGVEK